MRFVQSYYSALVERHAELLKEIPTTTEGYLVCAFVG